MNQPYFFHARYRPRGAAGLAAQSFWTVQAERCRTAVEAALPDCSVDLYFNLGAGGRHVYDHTEPAGVAPRAAWVVGARSQTLLISKEITDCDIVGVRLRAGVAAHLLGVPARVLNSDLVDLAHFWGSRTEEIRERLAETVDPLKRFTILEQEISARVRRAGADELRRTRALCARLARRDSRSIAATAAQLGLSHRRVIELLDDAVGLKPRVYRRVRRLRRALRLIGGMRSPAWGRLAVSCAYYDQAHLINEFRELTGLTPTQYAARRSSVGDGFVPHIPAVV